MPGNVDLDAIVRFVRARPWSSTSSIANAVSLAPDEAERALSRLGAAGILAREGDVWGLAGVKRVGSRDHPEFDLSPRDTVVLAAVRARPWGKYSDYAVDTRARDAYSSLVKLARRGLVQKAVKDLVFRWGPMGASTPPGVMPVEARLRSPDRQAFGPRVKAVLLDSPWLAVAELAARLHVNEKGLDTACRNLARQGDLRRATTPCDGRIVLTLYALPGTPDPTPADEERARTSARSRRPSHYGRTLDRIKHHLERDPWMTAQRLANATGLDEGNIQGALKRLRERGEVVRVADGTYRYALPGAPTRRFGMTGVLSRGGTGVELREIVLGIIGDLPGRSTTQLLPHVAEKRGRPYPGLSVLLHRLKRAGILENRVSPNAEGDKRQRVHGWFLARENSVDAQALLDRLHATAAALNAACWIVNVDARPANAATTHKEGASA